MSTLLNLPFVVTGCLLISPFGSLIGISVGITSSAIGLKIGGMTTGIHKSVIN